MMSTAELSIAALLVAIFVSCVSDVNVGFLALVLAWIVGTYFGGLTLAQLLEGFPTQLFLTLVGVTLLFSQAHVNGTLERIALQAARLCKGNRGVIAIMLFVLTLALSSIGPGNIAAAALMAPIGMGIAFQVGVPPFLAALMVANGASAGSLSPIAPTGIIANEIMAKQGMVGVAAETYLANVLVHTAVTLGGFVLLGGLRLLKTEPSTKGPVLVPNKLERFDTVHWMTVAVIATLIVSVIAFNVNVGMGAFVGAVFLTFLKAADEKRAIQQMPWRVMMMVSGMTVLIALLERTGGMDLFASALARVSTQTTVTAVTAFVTGAISIYSSTSGVVLPALLPTVPGIIEKLGGGDPLAIASSINVGGHLVDVSPLSTVGALCLASAPTSVDSRLLFNKLMAWGASMVVVGTVVCWLFFGVLGLP